MILSRRSFLIGSAATLAAAALPPPVAMEEVMTAVTPVDFPYRSVFDVTFSAIPDEAIKGLNCVTYEIFRKTTDREGVLHHIALHPLGMMRWCATPGSEFIFPQGHALGFRTTPAVVNADLSILFHIDRPNQGPKEFIEAHWEDIYDTDEFPYDYDEDYEPKVIDRQWVPGRWLQRRRIVSENYSWRGEKLEMKNYAYLDPRDDPNGV